MRQVAVISGGSRGIGLAIANYMINDGFITCVIGQREESLCTQAFAPLKEKGELYYFQGNVALENDRQAFVDSIVSRCGRIDVLVNNAGVAPKVRMDLLATTEESFDHVMSVNLKGTMFLTQAVAKVMVSQPKKDGLVQGVIVNMSSFSAWVSSPNRAEYCVSKAGISMLTKLYADRLAREGIYVYEVQPGIIRTDMTSSVTEKYDRLLSQGQFPIARWGTPEDVANVVSLLVKGNMSYTTGQVIHVDGGYADVRSL
jgi:3-oxoacyl-[acyl-carrier protein] reductase